MQTTLSLGRLVIELAVLLVEAQIDLRLKVAKSFTFAGIEFVRTDESPKTLHDGAKMLCL